MFHKHVWKYLLVTILLYSTIIFNAHAAGFSVGSGATVSGDSNIDVTVRNAIAIGLNTESRIMIGHVADGVHLHNNNMRIKVGNTVALGIKIFGVEKKACISIGVIGGHCF